MKASAEAGFAAAASLQSCRAEAHNFGMFDWNDLRYLLAVAREGSTLAAARVLGVNQSTVHRRLVELERRIGFALVVRHATGYRLTELGETLLPAAERVDEAVSLLQNQIRAYGDELVGIIRLTCPEPLVSRLVGSPYLDLFHENHPGLKIEFVMSDRYLDLGKGEADVALRSGEPDDERLIGRKIADSIWAVYASKSYLQHHGRPERIDDLGHHALVGFDGMLAGHRAANGWRRSHPLPGSQRATTVCLACCMP